MNEAEIKKSEKVQLRKFGLTVGIFTGILGGILFWKGQNVSTFLFIISGFLVFFGVVLPIVLWPIHKIWMKLAECLGWVMSRVILIVLFYFVVTPIGLFARLIGKKFVDLRFHTSSESYWIPKEEKYKDKSSYEKQF